VKIILLVQVLNIQMVERQKLILNFVDDLNVDMIENIE
jgi:hypothetical protein